MHGGTLQVRSGAIEIRIGDVSLAAKLDAIAATLAAVRDAHRDTMQTGCWVALHRAQAELADAILRSAPIKPLTIQPRAADFLSNPHEATKAT